MIYVLEGADGTGKTTLARKILDKTNGHYLHSTYDRYWNIQDYHQQIAESAISLNIYQDVVIDRWALSELIYGNVFREGPSYNVETTLKNLDNEEWVTWVYCKNDNAIINHLRNKRKRKEMFNDMTEVTKEYDKYINISELEWIIFDFNKHNLDDFVKDLLQ